MLYEFRFGAAPLLIDVPHAGTTLPRRVQSGISTHARSLPDTDWHVHDLVQVSAASEASVLCALHSRYVIDLNRGPDNAPLYRGPTTGLVPTETFDGDPIYKGPVPDALEIKRRIERYWQPYHDKLRELLDETLARHGHAVLLDVHSIRSRVPRLFDGRLPDLNLGTNDGASCDAGLRELVVNKLAEADGFTHVVDGRFKGGYITRHYGRPDEGVHALQLEIAQSCYMDESRPQAFDADAARPLMTLLEDLIGMLSRWRPA